MVQIPGILLSLPLESSTTMPDDDDLKDLLGLDELDSNLSEAEIKLLRVALVEHGLRLGALEAKLDSQMADLRSIRSVVRQTLGRMKHIAKILGIDNNGDASK